MLKSNRYSIIIIKKKKKEINKTKKDPANAGVFTLGMFVLVYNISVHLIMQCPDNLNK